MEAFEQVTAQLDGLTQLSMASMSNQSVTEARRLDIRQSLDNSAKTIQVAWRQVLSGKEQFVVTVLLVNVDGVAHPHSTTRYRRRRIKCHNYFSDEDSDL